MAASDAWLLVIYFAQSSAVVVGRKFFEPAWPLGPLVTTFAYGPGGPSSSSETSLIVSGIFELPLTNLNKLAKFG